MSKYFIGMINSGTKVAFQSAKDADDYADEWVEIKANSLEEAFDKYEEAFEEWRHKCLTLPT